MTGLVFFILGMITNGFYFIAEEIAFKKYHIETLYLVG